MMIFNMLELLYNCGSLESETNKKDDVVDVSKVKFLEIEFNPNVVIYTL